MKCLLVYNPVSGGSKKLLRRLPYVIKELKKNYDLRMEIQKELSLNS